MSSAAPLTAKPKHKKKSKEKDKYRDKGGADPPIAQTSVDGRNEGFDPNWAYKPPAGMVALDTAHMDEKFDWDDVKDGDKELWLLRIPEGFKIKQLEGVQIHEPRSALDTRLMTLERKRAKYDVWAIDTSRAQDAGKNDLTPPRGEELTHLSCLLPRKKKKGRLYISSKPISQHIVITHVPAEPHIRSEIAPTPSIRHGVPRHLLKHKFVPYGAESSGDKFRRDLDIGDEFVGKEKHRNKANFMPGAIGEFASLPQEIMTPKKSTLSSSQSSPTKSGKKRKATGEDDESPKRHKKLKA